MTHLSRSKGWIVAFAVTCLTIVNCNQKNTHDEYHLHGAQWTTENENDQAISNLAQIIHDQPDNISAYIKHAETMARLRRSPT